MLTDRFGAALVMAEKLHRDQRRKKTNIPYVSHLLAVTGLVLEHGGDETAAIAALLHDAIEDQGGDAARQQIRAAFGDAVVAIVDGCTDAEVIPKPPWRQRKESYLAKLEREPKEVALVACADKLHNARTTLDDLRAKGSATWATFNAGRADQLWYYNACVQKLRGRAPDRLVDELARTVAAMEALG